MGKLSDSSRKEFEEFMAERFEKSIDRRRCKNGDGNDYMSWDMNVARAVWQHLSQRAEAAETALNTVRAQRDLEVTRNDRAEEEKAKLHAEIYRLQEEVRGPDGFDTWKDAALALKLAAKNTDNDIDYLTAMSAFHSKDWHKMDPITGYMKGWNARPAPAINLVELVPEERPVPPFKTHQAGLSIGFNACRAAILRNIEELK